MIDGKTVACLGGTFNRIHAGHRLLLSTAFGMADRVAVGVSSDALVRRLRGAGAASVRPFQKRADDVRRLLAPYGEERFELLTLDDPYIAAHRAEFDAIVVSPDTLERAEEINALRDLHGMDLLKVVTVDLVLAYNGKPISATRILAGEIDEEGKPVGKHRPPKAAPPVEASVPAPPAPPAPEPPAPVMAAPPAPAPEMQETPALPEPQAARAVREPTAQIAPKRKAKLAAKSKPKLKGQPKAKPKVRPKLRSRPKRASKKPTGKKAAKKPARGRSKARKGNRPSGPRSRR